MNEELSYIFYTIFKNLQEIKEKPPWCLFEIYHMYVKKTQRPRNIDWSEKKNKWLAPRQR